MASDLYNQMGGFDKGSFMKELEGLKKKGGDPNQMIQSLLNSGRVTQAQVNAASNKAQMIMQMLTPSAHR